MWTKKAYDDFCLEFIELHSDGKIYCHCFTVEGFEGERGPIQSLPFSGCQGMILVSISVVESMVGEDGHKNWLDICNQIMIQSKG